MEKDTFYITTPIYYPSDKLHIGHTYCTVATDTLARYHRLKGEDVMFLTGTDEHGQKIEQKADEAGVTPQEFVDRIVEGPRGVRDLWKLMNISNDRFIRTTDDYHVKAIQRIFKRMYDKGDIYKGTYKGKYCTPCESFWTESQLKDGCCPDCGRPVVDAEEEAYFFRLSKYADRIRDLLENTDFLQPRSRVNEMVKNFIDPGLEDLCVSRTSLKWGIPVDFDPKHTVYVWVDALTNYINALGYGSEDDSLFQKYLEDFHLPAKQKIKHYSRGMTMKLAIAAALAHHPELLILDEATSGLDPIMRDEMLDVFLEFVQEENHSILLSSHITSDLEKVADYITFIHNGKLIMTVSKNDLVYNYAVMRCKESQFLALDPKDILAYRKRDFQIDVLVSNGKEAQRKYKGVVIDHVSVDEIMLLLVKGERV